MEEARERGGERRKEGATFLGFDPGWEARRWRAQHFALCFSLLESSRGIAVVAQGHRPHQCAFGLLWAHLVRAPAAGLVPPGFTI